MSDLAEFLLACFAEDEAMVNVRTKHLAPAGSEMLEQFGDFGDDERWMIEIPADRLLAECDAKRRIVEMHRGVQIGFGPNVIGCDTCNAEMGETWGPDLLAPGESLYPCDTLRLLALPYSDHPDYREEWRP